MGALTLAIIAAAGVAAAQPDGTLDPTFGVDGVARASVGSGLAHALGRSVLQQADGKVVVATTLRTGGSFSLNGIALVRLTADGALDPSFGQNGQMTIGIPGTSTTGRAMIQQADGKLVVLARPLTGTSAIALLRYHADGSPDAAFGTDGLALVSAGDPMALAQQADGKLLVASQRLNSSTNYDFAVVRFTADGSLDGSFGSDGVASLAIGTGDDVPRAIAVQDDGRIVVAGSTVPSGSSGPATATARFLPDGAVDTSFGSGGKVVTFVGSAYDSAEGVTVNADGTIVVGGWGSGGGSTDFAAVRYLSNGTLDPTFGTAGVTLVAVTASSDQARAMTALAGGGVALAGETGGQSGFGVVRLTAAGQPDPGFGVNGQTTIDILPSFEGAYGITQQADGKLIAVGHAYGSDGRQRVAIVRYATDGALDQSFGGTGVVLISPSLRSDWPHALALQADGKIVAAGRAFAYPDDDFGVARLEPSGALDPTFGEGGRLLTRISGAEDLPAGIVVQPDGKLVVAGEAVVSGTQKDFSLVRYNTDGALDSTFGTGGIALHPITVHSDSARAVILQPDGKLVVGGYQNSNPTFLLARYTPAGALDFSFGGGGIVTTTFITTGFVNALALQPDGKIVAAGYRNDTFSGSDVALARYLPNGALDTSFGSGGRVITSVVSGNDQARAVALLPDGHIVVAGYALTGGSVSILVVRYTADGVPDPTFGSGGIVVTGFGTRRAFGYGLRLQRDGKVVVAGALDTTPPGFGPQAALFRYRTDGSLDPTFGDGGVVTNPDLSISNAQTAPVVQTEDGALILAAPAIDASGSRSFALARYLVTTCGDGRAAGDEACDDGNMLAGDCCDTGCQFEAADTECVDDGLLCTADRCDGSGQCLHAAGNIGLLCRAAAGVCDLAEACDGDGVDCPADVRSTAICRTAAGVCDLAESCDGDGVDCPADVRSTAVCRSAAGVCDLAESCDGDGVDCPADVRSTAVCRSAAGVCDLAESCDGLGSDCPADAHSTAVCRTAAGGCDLAESCDGLGADCPADARSTAVCRAAAGACDVAESCDGDSLECPVDAMRDDGASCDDGLFCNGEATCLAGVCSAGTPPCPLACDESGGQCVTACPPVAREDCRDAATSVLSIRRKKSPAQDVLVWKWLRGEATGLLDFGEPRAATGYALCLYRGDQALVADGVAVVDGGSGWRTIGSTGFGYADASGQQSGLRKLQLRAGVQGRASLLVKGKGVALPDPSLPIDALPLTVQLVNTEQRCWQSTFAASSVRRNDAGQFRAAAR